MDQRILKVRPVFILLWFLFSSQLYAQFSSFVTYGLEDGLPSNTAYYAFKDADGYLWITTDRGVVKYDGYSFRTYTTQDGLSDNEIFEVFQDSKKRIWLSTFNGVPTIYSNGSFYNFSELFKLKKISPNGPTYRILETPEGIWIMNRKALYKVTNNQIKIFNPGALSYVSMAYHPQEKKMYLLHSSISKAISIDETNNVDTVTFPTAPPTNISKLLIKGNLLFYTAWKQLCTFDLSAREGFSMDLGQEVLSIFNTNNDSLVITGCANDVFEYNIRSGQLRKKFIDHAGVSSIFLDSDRSYWTTSINNGVSFFGNEKVEALTNKNILPFEYVSLVRKIGNRLFITSDKFRFCVYNMSTKKIEGNYNDEGKIPGRGFANAIRVSNEGNVYISFRIILLKIDKQGNITRIPLKQVSYDLMYTPKYYVAIHVEQISRREPSKSIAEIGEDFESMDITARHLYYDSTTSNMFAYGAGGLYKINIDSFNRVRSYSHIPEVSSNISSVAKFNDSILVVGTTINGMHFLKNDRLVASLSYAGGLASNYVHCMYVEGNEIWVGTDQGINLINLDLAKGKMSMQHLGKKDGIFSNEINDIYIDNDTVYVATPSGLFYFHKKDIKGLIEKPVLNIEYIKFNMVEVNLYDPSKLKSKQKDVKVKFTGISYGSLGNITYRYKLAPIDDQWHYTNSREIEYPSLAPNEYSLSIQCKGSRGSWSDIKTIQFEIIPALWQRLEVQLLFVVCIIIILALLIRIRIKALRNAHQIKEKILRLENEKLEDVKNQAIKDKEIIELEQQALRLHMNPHFIFNAINAIQGFYAGNEVNKAKQFISYFSRLLRLILETSKEKLIPVSTEIEILKSYLELFLLRFEDKYSYEINVDPEIDEDTDLIPPMVVQPFVENAVLHGLSPLKEPGRITIDFEMEEDILKVSIRDNGIGRKKSQEIKKTSKSKSTGIKVTQMRLKNIDSKLKIHQNVEIVDLEDEAGSTGTLVILRMPLSSK